MPLTNVAKLIVAFPASVKGIPARDFLHRIVAKRVRKSNPECDIQVRVLRSTDEPGVEVTFKDKTSQTLDFRETSGAQLVDKLRVVSKAGDTNALLEKAGLRNLKLDAGSASAQPGRVQKTQVA